MIEIRFFRHFGGDDQERLIGPSLVSKPAPLETLRIHAMRELGRRTRANMVQICAPDGVVFEYRD